MDYRTALTRMQKSGTAGSILFWIACFTGATQSAAAQSHRPQMIAAVKDACHSSKTRLAQDQLPRLRRRQIAFAMVFGDWGEKMPAHLREHMPAEAKKGLDDEVAAFKGLLDSYDATERVLTDCERITEQTDRTTIVQWLNQVRTINDVLRQLSIRWADRQAGEANFKASLDKVVALMMQYNPAKTATYITMKVNLDPDQLDQLVDYQSTLLLGPELALRQLK